MVGVCHVKEWTNSKESNRIASKEDARIQMNIYLWDEFNSSSIFCCYSNVISQSLSEEIAGEIGKICIMRVMVYRVYLMFISSIAFEIKVFGRDRKT
jgi:hypothetical protein